MPFGVIIANDSRQLEKLRQLSSFDSTDRHDRPDQGSMLLGVSHFWVVSLCEVVDQNSSSIFVPFCFSVYMAGWKHICQPSKRDAWMHERSFIEILCYDEAAFTLNQIPLFNVHKVWMKKLFSLLFIYIGIFSGCNQVFFAQAVHLAQSAPSESQKPAIKRTKCNKSSSDSQYQM